MNVQLCGTPGHAAMCMRAALVHWKQGLYGMRAEER